MPTPRSLGGMRPGARPLLALLLLCMLLLSACGGDAQVHQQASQQQTQLDQLLQHAQAIGVPATLLQPVMKQKQQLEGTSAPFNLFNDQPATNYYRNIGTRYGQLLVQTQGIIDSTTAQDQSQAQHDVQSFNQNLSQARSKKQPVQYFTQQLTQLQSSLTAAKTPKGYTAVSAQSHTIGQVLDAMSATDAQLQTFKNTVNQMHLAGLDTSAMQMQYQSDQQKLAAGQATGDFQHLGTLINAQYLQAVVSTNLALPYVTVAKLSDLTSKYQFLKTNGVDISPYQQQYDTDTAMAHKIKNVQDYINFSKQVDTAIASMHDDLVTGQAKALLQQFHKEADAWSKAHMYHNKFDNKNYSLAAAYQDAGIGSMLDEELTWCYTVDDFQSMIGTINDEIYSLHMLEADYTDHTSYTKVHATDMQLLSHYKLQKGQVIVVSTIEQAMRLYQDGKLVKSFLVTTGRVELPALPGNWSVQNRESPTVFKSPDPPSSPFWYPPTPIHYAILYHHGGYFIHDSWWRADYGPGTQFPHYDSGGDEGFAGNGSHGCVNVQLDQAAWLFSHTDFNTQIIIY
ncbi:MAG: L,D-transpeptidase [Chloroflexota bacterium]|nr:L,D-transpeptidase [Chloroflexota bacterium]